MMKLVLSCLCVIGLTHAHAQITPHNLASPTEQPASPRHARSTENERLLPATAVRDADRRNAEISALALNGNWVLIVLDAEMATTATFLSALAAKQDTLDERTTILLAGSDLSIEKLRAQIDKVSRVRWLYSDTSVMKTLNLAAVPSMLGIRANKKVAWTFSGLAGRPEFVLSAIDGWLRLNPVSGSAAQ